MDLQLFLALNAMTLSAMVVAAIFIYRPPGDEQWLVANRPWLAVNALVLAVGGLALWLAPEIAGAAVLLIFVPFVVLPVALFNLSERRASRGWPVAAARLATAAACLHPTTTNWMHAKLLAANAGSAADNARALQALAKTAPPQYRPLVAAQLARARNDWGEILAMAVPDGPGAALMKPLEIRALGETGQIDAMVRCYWAARRKLAGASGLLPRLMVLAFGGRPEAVARLLADDLTGLPPEVKAYWAAVALLHSLSDTSAGRRALETLAATATTDETRAAAHRRLAAFAAAPPAPLSRESQAGLDVVAAQVLADNTAPLPHALTFPVTLALIALNGAAYVAELLQGGPDADDVLLRLGAMAPDEIVGNGEWWRLLTGCFLHASWIHIGSNMFVLFVLGRLLEPLIGSLRLAVIYLVGGIASSAFVLWLMISGITEATLLVGASGAIFALFGAEVMLVLDEWYRARATFDTRRLQMLGLILGVQVIMDLSVPQVSFSAHASGFLTGLMVMALALAMQRRWGRRPLPTRAPVQPDGATGSTVASDPTTGPRA